MAKQPDLRRNPPPTPQLQMKPLALPAEIAANAPQLRADQPVPRGQLLMTEYSRQQLSKLGWKEGDPVPGDLGARIREMQEMYEKDRADAKHAVPEGWSPVQPKLVQIDELPAERQAELRQYVSDYKNQVSEEAAVAQQQKAQEAQINPDSPPSVQAAQRVALAAAGNQGFAFVNDLPAAPAGKQLGGVTGISPNFAKLAAAKAIEAPPPPPPPVTEPAPPAAAGALPELTHCPRCTWDLRMAFRIEPTDEDKNMYRAALLGGGRFAKEVVLLDGGVRLRFRSLTPREVRLMREQMRYDARAGKILGDGDMLAEMWEYNLVMSVAQVRFGDTVVDIPPIHEVPYDPPKPDDPPETPLVKMQEWFYTEAVPTETLARIVREHHQQFCRLTEYLETMSQDPNFFTGIAQER